MIKKYWEITLREYNVMERTGNVKQFRKSSVPMFLLKKKLNKELDKLNKVLNLPEDELEQKKEHEIWKVESEAKINAIEINFLGILNILELGTKLNGFEKDLNRKMRRKLKWRSGNLRYYVGRIEEYTGIKVRNQEDLEKVGNDLQFRKDKYKENFKEDTKQPERIYLMSIALGVFSYLNQPLDVEMTVVEFAALREDANKRIKKESIKTKE